MLPRIVITQPASFEPGGDREHVSIISDLRRTLSIVYWTGIGALLLWLPWSGFWEDNYLIYLYPQFRPLVANAFFKGFVLGLGIVNILIGLNEIAHRKDHPQKKVNFR